MKDNRFDEWIRHKAQKEAFTPTLEAETKLTQAIRAGGSQWPSKARKTASSMHWLAAGAAAVAAVLVLLLFTPFSDSRMGMEQLTAAQPAFTPVPVTLPEVFLEAHQHGSRLDTAAAFSNHTGDLWIIRWNLALEREGHSVRELPAEMIWLETGITFTDNETFFFEAGDWPDGVRLQCGYQAYRVTAKMLHWMDGEWLRPGQDGYEEQQSLMESAVAAGALILYPGEWPEGSSGEMKLLLPDSAPKSSPEEILGYYVQNGMLEEAASGTVSAETAQPLVE